MRRVRYFGALLLTVSPLQYVDAEIVRLTPQQARALLGDSAYKAMTAARTGDAYRQALAKSLIGQGYDIWHQNKTNNICIAYAGAPLKTPGVAGNPSSHNWSFVSVISNEAQHFQNSSTSVSASVSYEAFSLGGSVGHGSSSGYSSFSEYIDVSKGVIGDYFAIPPNPALNQRANTVLVSGRGKGPLADDPDQTDPKATRKVQLDDRTAFIALCGQRYIAGVGFGVALKGNLAFETTLDQHASTNSASVTLGVSIIRLGVANATTYSDLSKVSAMSLNFPKGAFKQTPSVDRAWDAISDYGSHDEGLNSDDPVLLDLQPYTTTARPEFLGRYNIEDEAQGTIANLTFSLAQAVQELTDLRKVADKPAGFQKPSGSYADDMQHLGDYLDKLGPVYKKCSLTYEDVVSLPACQKAAKDVGLPPPITTVALQ